MTRTLILLRHAKAEPGNAETADFDRPLATRGVAQSASVGRRLATAGLVPDVALVSDAARTRQTWGIVAGQLPVSANVDVRHSVALYAAYVDDVIDALAEVDDEAATVIVVGHEPTISSTAARLAGPGSDLGACAEVRVGVPTATYALLTFDGPWSGLGQGTARLVSVVRP